MILKTKYRQLLHYSLIGCTLLIQIVILVFFYNEYFNGKKLSAIEKQIQTVSGLKKLTDNSRKNLISARENLQDYISGNKKENLDVFFQSLRKLSDNIDGIKAYENNNPTLKDIFSSKREEIEKLTHLNALIDSVYNESQKPLLKKEAPEIKNFEVKNNPTTLEIEIRHSSDSVAKKGLLPRLKDAIKGNVEVKRDTTYITTRYESSIDTNRIKTDLDSTINEVNTHYQKEIKKYQSHITTTDDKNNNLYRIYDNLILLSNNLMEIYEGTIADFNSNLQKQYIEQNSANNKIRKYSVLGLIVLMFLNVLYKTCLCVRK